MELLLRFWAFAKPRDCLGDNWFLFDLVLVILMVWETWIEVICFSMFRWPSPLTAESARTGCCFRMLRLLRMLRVARATRLVHNAPELLILARGIFEGMRSVLAVLCLCGLVIYIFAIMFTELLAGRGVIPPGTFDNVPESMDFLLRTVLCGPDAHFMVTLLDAHWSYYCLFILFLVITVVMIMNMLIGILCDVVAKVADESKEDAFEQEVSFHVNKMATALDTDGSGTLSRAELETIIRDPDLAQGFNSIGVDIIGLADFARFCFEQCDEMTYDEYTQLVYQFRGSKNATLKDLMALRRYLSMELVGLEARLATGTLHQLAEWHTSVNGANGSVRLVSSV